MNLTVGQNRAPDVHMRQAIAARSYALDLGVRTRTKFATAAA